ncbi:MAG TPA: alpha/beta hydrolase domain-containing protein [Terriglobia bacterium]
MKAFGKITLSLVAGAILFCFPGIGLAQTAVTPAKLTGPVPSTKDNYAFLSANRVQSVVDLQKVGYIEEEYIVSGRANVYDWTADGLKVRTPNAPYTSRILIRRPADAAKFSGNVIIEPVDTARVFDWSFMWAVSHEYFTEHGDAWVGVTHTAASIAALKKFNAQRYAALSFANPTPDEACGPANAKSPNEDGLKFDMLGQIASALKSANGPIAGFRAQRVYATSHGGEIVTYAQAIQPQSKAFDGFVFESNAGPAAISRCAAAVGANDLRRITRNVGVPVIRMVPEGDVPQAYALRREDSDAPNDRFRWYEVAAAPRMDIRYYQHMPAMEDQTKSGESALPGNWPFAYTCGNPVIGLEDLPVFQVAMNSAFYNIDQWARNGTAPPRAERMAVKDAGTPQATVAADQYGNGLGGVRSPHVEVPVATYYAHSPGQATCRNIGYKVPFDWARLESLYGSSKTYASKVNAEIDKLVEEKWLLPADAKRLREELLSPSKPGSN